MASMLAPLAHTLRSEQLQHSQMFSKLYNIKGISIFADKQNYFLFCKTNQIKEQKYEKVTIINLT
jgi:hypothetical protein